jgi:hypothetical protein
MPPALGRLSNTIWYFQASDSFCPTMRPRVSTALPGDTVVSMRTGRAGYCACADACIANNAAQAATIGANARLPAGNRTGLLFRKENHDNTRWRLNISSTFLSFATILSESGDTPK